MGFPFGKSLMISICQGKLPRIDLEDIPDEAIQMLKSADDAHTGELLDVADPSRRAMSAKAQLERHVLQCSGEWRYPRFDCE